MIRAIVYARVSYDDRSRPADNLVGQIEECRAYCQERDYQVVAELAEDDRGVSGAAWDLPAISQALEMAEAREFDVLVVRELDRFARDTVKTLTLERLFSNHGVAVEFVLGQYEDTPEGQFLKTVRAAVAQLEKDLITARMSRARKRIVKSGRVILHGTRPPYGYDLENRRLVICEEEARIVRLIFQWYTQQGLGSRAIAKKLTSMRVATWMDTTESPLQKKKGYGEWSHTSVGDMLSNPVYKGLWYYGRGHDRKDRAECIEVEVPAIVSEETWKAAQERKTRNRDMAKRRTKHEYLLRRRVACGHCGATMSAKTVVCNDGRNRYSYYRCDNKQCDNKYFRADQVDRITLRWLTETLENPRVLRQRIEELKANQEKAAKPLQERLAVIDDLLEEHQAQLSRLLDLYLGGQFDREILAERKARLETTIHDLESERAKAIALLGSQTAIDDDSLLDIGRQVAHGLYDAYHDFEIRRHHIEQLGVEAKLYVESGRRMIQLQCTLRDADALSIEADSLKTAVQQKTTLAR